MSTNNLSSSSDDEESNDDTLSSELGSKNINYKEYPLAEVWKIKAKSHHFVSPEEKKTIYAKIMNSMNDGKSGTILCGPENGSLSHQYAVAITEWLRDEHHLEAVVTSKQSLVDKLINNSIVSSVWNSVLSYAGYTPPLENFRVEVCWDLEGWSKIRGKSNNPITFGN